MQPPTLASLVTLHAYLRPQTLAAVRGQTRLTYQQLWQQAGALAALLAAHPTPPRRIGLCSRDPLHFLLGLLATQRLGLEVTLLPSHLPPERLAALGSGLDWLLTDCGPWESESVRCVPLGALLEHPATLPAPSPSGQARLHLLTSGTSQAPRLLNRTQAAWEQLPAFAGLLGTLRLRPQMPILLPLPLYHGHGPWVLALGLALGSPIFFSRDVAEQWRILHQEGIELLSTVPTQLYRLLQTPQPRPPALRTLLCGSGPLSRALALAALDHFGPVLHNLYGTTETGLIAHASPADLRRNPGSVGRVLPGVKLQLVGGEVCVRRGKTLIHTGDMAQWRGGALYLQGRQDDLIVRGGECLFPEWLEEQLQHPELAECAAIGVPDAEYGQAIYVFAVCMPGSALDAETLLRHWEGTLPRTLLPAGVTFLPALPRNAVGKLLRRELRRNIHAAPK